MDEFDEKYDTSLITGMTYQVTKELSERGTKDLFPEQIAHTKEPPGKVYPEQFKAVTGKNLFKK